jgi:hypothetical protein
MDVQTDIGHVAKMLASDKQDDLADIAFGIHDRPVRFFDGRKECTHIRLVTIETIIVYLVSHATKMFKQKS